MKSLHSALRKRPFQSFSYRKSSYKIPLKPGEAKDGRDALSKRLYSAVFEWLVVRINQRLMSNDHHGESLLSLPFIGLLGILSFCFSLEDIFGFEVFYRNSFEQFCINYCNVCFLFGSHRRKNFKLYSSPK